MLSAVFDRYGLFDAYKTVHRTQMVLQTKKHLARIQRVERVQEQLRYITGEDQDAPCGRISGTGHAKNGDGTEFTDIL